MGNERKNNGSRLDTVRNAASGYAVVVLGILCFVLSLAVLTTVVRVIVGASAGVGM